MSEGNKEDFELEDAPDVDVNENDNEVFPTDDKQQWIGELRAALERGCDLGTIRNIGKCRPLTDDLRLSVWKVRQPLLPSVHCI